MAGTSYESELVKLRDGRDVSFFDLVSVDQLTPEDLDLIVPLARKFREAKTTKLSLCKGKAQVNLFFEPSTRTQASFDLAAKELSKDMGLIITLSRSVIFSDDPKGAARNLKEEIHQYR